MKLVELLDYIWPNKVAIYLGEADGINYTPLQCFTDRVFDIADANNYFPEFMIYDIYADQDFVVIALAKKNTAVPRTKSNAATTGEWELYQESDFKWEEPQ